MIEISGCENNEGTNDGVTHGEDTKDTFYGVTCCYSHFTNPVMALSFEKEVGPILKSAVIAMYSPSSPRGFRFF